MQTVDSMYLDVKSRGKVRSLPEINHQHSKGDDIVDQKARLVKESINTEQSVLWKARKCEDINFVP